ncbi:MAG: SH3 domain-containing protein [Synergistaceae bacterium]|nr:SH3 domain-containing protein [Synergistaceae bacterium]
MFCGGKCVYQSVDVSGGYVLKATMNIRKGASPEAEIIGYAKKGTVVEVADIKNDRLEIRHNGQTAYILYGNGEYAEKCTQD